MCIFSDCSKIASYLNSAKKEFRGWQGRGGGYCCFPKCLLFPDPAAQPVSSRTLSTCESPVPVIAQAAGQFLDKSYWELTNRKIEEQPCTPVKTRPTRIQVMPTVPSRHAGSDHLTSVVDQGPPNRCQRWTAANSTHPCICRGSISPEDI